MTRKRTLCVSWCARIMSCTMRGRAPCSRRGAWLAVHKARFLVMGGEEIIHVVVCDTSYLNMTVYFTRLTFLLNDCYFIPSNW